MSLNRRLSLIIPPELKEFNWHAQSLDNDKVRFLIPEESLREYLMEEGVWSPNVIDGFLTLDRFQTEDYTFDKLDRTRPVG